MNITRTIEELYNKEFPSTPDVPSFREVEDWDADDWRQYASSILDHTYDLIDAFRERRRGLTKLRAFGCPVAVGSTIRDAAIALCEQEYNEKVKKPDAFYDYYVQIDESSFVAYELPGGYLLCKKQ